MGALLRNGPEKNARFQGVLAGIGAFAAWGLLPIYWKQLQGVEPMEILCHRVLWSLLMVGSVLFVRRQSRGFRELFREPGKIALLMLSGLFIGLNWLIYIWAVNSGRVLDTSLGYFINPLVSVLFGCLFFKERLRKLQICALVLALGGVLYQMFLLGRLPMVSLGLALSFGFYGLIRKWVRVDVLTGLFVETFVLALPAAIYLVYREHSGLGAFGHGTCLQDVLLAGTGLVTSLPLLAFAFGARRVSLASIGFLQYIAPSITFVLGVFLFHEPLEMTRLVTFVLIWIAIVFYSMDNLLVFKRDRATSGNR